MDYSGMTPFQTKRICVEPDEVAPDGSAVRVLLDVSGGLMAVYELAPAQVSTAVANRTIEEIWYFLSGRGLMWRCQGEREEVVPVDAGVCVTITLGTQFQVCSLADESLVAVGVTIPPWPGKDEQVVVQGPWQPTLPKNDAFIARPARSDECV
jgi:mannose-6-phosphate isomerase-like protein (cupin superfamily)